MKLFIVESPGKVKKIQGFLGPSWKVVASVGHVRDLPERTIGVEPPDFVPRYEATERGAKVVNALGSFGFLDYEFTKRMEEQLDAIAEGREQYQPVVAVTYNALQSDTGAYPGRQGGFRKRL